MTRSSSEHTVAYVGSRTTPGRNGRGRGIEVYDIGPGAEGWTPTQTVELDNPAFLALDHTRRYLYAVHGDLTYVSAFRVEPGTGRLHALGCQETGGRNPAHLAVAPSNRFLVVANHSSGSVATLPLRADGGLGPVADLLLLPGEPGPHRTEQTGSKPNQVPFAPDGRFLVVPDKGLDRVFTLPLDATSGKLSPGPVPYTATREMAGPRHLCFHPALPYAYTVDELRSTVTTYRWDAARGAAAPGTAPPGARSPTPSASSPSRRRTGRCGRWAGSPPGASARASSASALTGGGCSPPTSAATPSWRPAWRRTAARSGRPARWCPRGRPCASSSRRRRADPLRMSGPLRMKCPRPPHEERRG